MVKQDLPFVNPCQLGLIPWLSCDAFSPREVQYYSLLAENSMQTSIISERYRGKGCFLKLTGLLLMAVYLVARIYFWRQVVWGGHSIAFDSKPKDRGSWPEGDRCPKNLLLLVSEKMKAAVMPVPSPLCTRTSSQWVGY